MRRVRIMPFLFFCLLTLRVSDVFSASSFSGQVVDVETDVFLFQHDTCPICRKSLNGEDSTWQTQSSEASASNRFSSDSQLHDRWTF